MQIIRKHSKEILVFIGVSAVAAAGYAVLVRRRKGSSEGRDQSDPAKRSIDGQPQNSLPVVGDKFLQDKPKIQRENGYLSKDTVINILSTVLAEANKYLEPISRKNREERRKVINNQEEYARIFQSYIEEFENFNNEITERICFQRGVDPEDYINSLEHLIVTGNKEIEELQTSIAQTMKGSFSSTKILTKDQIIEVVNYQCELIKLEKHKVTSDPYLGMMMMNSPGLTFNLLQTRVDDLLFEKFGCDDRDIFQSVSVNNLRDDPDIQTSISKLQQALNG
eukprot:TRINITY_DN17869_c0_g1_i1.p1 TRINITY_DN17869_c0_g1~~TRINITY_DN17869_c0_g1_i1.p1  ORF type:complete len:280 (-),score=54.44 TRINITY_DN17869_c0_g1_i1:139-978(-)